MSGLDGHWSGDGGLVGSSLSLDGGLMVTGVGMVV